MGSLNKVDKVCIIQKGMILDWNNGNLYPAFLANDLLYVYESIFILNLHSKKFKKTFKGKVFLWLQVKWICECYYYIYL